MLYTRLVHVTAALMSALGASIALSTPLVSSGIPPVRLASSSMQFEQVVIAGIVRDAETGKPIEGVQLQLQGRTTGAMSQASGRYSITVNGIVRGSVESLRARRLGYQAVITPVVLKGDTVRVDFSLKASNQSLASVEIQAAVSPLIQRNNSGSAVAVNPAPVSTPVPVSMPAPKPAAVPTQAAPTVQMALGAVQTKSSAQAVAAGRADLARDRRLLVRQNGWIDEPSLSIPSAYAATGQLLSYGLAARGDSVRAMQVLETVNELVRAGRLSR